ncbi:MAG TPA: sensor histidine kinase [Candidatus Aquabacterium excrementipullorum]|nr:sensor histidine kinase [Candidatus Aquabacterium excrementipullorum]
MWAVTAGDEAVPEGGRLLGNGSATFDVCHVGVVLRVVLGVQAVLWLATLYDAVGLADWLLRWGLASAVGLPGCLMWLVGVCAARRWLGRRASMTQWVLVVGWGALSAVYGHVQFWLMDWRLGLQVLSPWALLPPMATGAAMAAVCLAWLRQRQGRADPAQVQARLVELQARIRPHFLFNTLNTAIALVQVDPERAEAVLEDLAELFRRALSSPSTQSSLADEVELARRYLGIEQLRFGERLSVNWHVDEAACAALVPTLLLQPLVENAVKHGVEVDPAGGWIRVEASRKGSRVVVTVSNSVPLAGQPAAGGLDTAALPGQASASRRGHGIALRNVRQRLLLMHDVQAEFETALRPVSPDARAQCFVVRLSFPAGGGA